MGLKTWFKKYLEVPEAIPTPRVSTWDEVMNPIPIESQAPKAKTWPNMIIRVLRRFTLGYGKSRQRSGWSDPDYDLSEVDKAEDTESLLKVSINKYTEKIINCGWQLRGKNSITRAYIRRRLDEMGLATGVPWERTFAEALRNAIKYCNTFLYFRRSSEFSSGKPVTIYGLKKDPIAGVFCIDPTSMRPKTDKYNNVTQWRQELSTCYSGWFGPGGSNTKTYERYDILHIYRNRKSGFVFGTPDYISVFDDIRALRQMEDQVDMLVHKHAMPLFHLKVGSEERPAGKNVDGLNELDVVRTEFQSMPAEGALVTSERVTITAIGADNKALDVDPYLKNYRQRVQLGVYLSDTDIGSGDLANRSTARQLSLMFQDRCKAIMRCLEEFITNGFFNLLLIEGGYTLSPNNIVELKFNEIDLENRMSINNHAMALYQGHMITRTEARNMSNLPELEKSQDKDMYWDLIEKKALLIRSIDEVSGLGSKPATANRNQPTNQKGTKMAKTRPKNDALVKLLSEFFTEDQGLVAAKAKDVDLLNVEINAIINKSSMQEYKKDALVGEVCGLIASHFYESVATGMQDMAQDCYVGPNILPGFANILRDKVAELIGRFDTDMSKAESVLDKSLAAEMCFDDLSRFAATVKPVARGYGVIRGKILLEGAASLGLPLNKIGFNDIHQIILDFS